MTWEELEKQAEEKDSLALRIQILIIREMDADQIRATRRSVQMFQAALDMRAEELSQGDL